MTVELSEHLGRLQGLLVAGRAPDALVPPGLVAQRLVASLPDRDESPEAARARVVAAVLGAPERAAGEALHAFRRASRRGPRGDRLAFLAGELVLGSSVPSDEVLALIVDASIVRAVDGGHVFARVVRAAHEEADVPVGRLGFDAVLHLLQAFDRTRAEQRATLVARGLTPALEAGLVAAFYDGYAGDITPELLADLHLEEGPDLREVYLSSFLVGDVFPRNEMTFTHRLWQDPADDQVLQAYRDWLARQRQDARARRVERYRRSLKGPRRGGA